MNKIFSTIAIAALIMVAMGCDKIDDPHKPFTYNGGGKTVLIKDFTGVRCIYCPGAAETVHQLQHELGEDHVMILSVHAGSMTTPGTLFPDFRTSEGTIWYNSNTSNPLFSVDHVALTEGNALFVSQVDTPLSEALKEDQTFEITTANTYDEATRRLSVENRFNPTGQGRGQYYATVCLVEDSIVGRQMVLTSPEYPDGVDTAYMFRNVFRGTLNGADGAQVINGDYFAGDSFDLPNYNIELDSAYNADQCYIMTYIYDKANGKIMQTALKKIK